jgi:hypothetical protein
VISNLPAFDFTVCTVAPQVELIGGGLGTTYLPYANKTIGKYASDNRPYDDVLWWYFTPKSLPTLEAFADALRCPDALQPGFELTTHNHYARLVR